MIIVQDFKPIRLHEKTPVRNLPTIVDLLIHSGGQPCPKRYYSRLKKSCGGPNLVLGSKLVNIVRMSPLLVWFTLVAKGHAPSSEFVPGFWCRVGRSAKTWTHQLRVLISTILSILSFWPQRNIFSSDFVVCSSNYMNWKLWVRVLYC